MNLCRVASSSWDKEISDCRWGSAFIQSDFEINRVDGQLIASLRFAEYVRKS